VADGPQLTKEEKSDVKHAETRVGFEEERFQVYSTRLGLITSKVTSRIVFLCNIWFGEFILEIFVTE
jgi:hypothetical protein